MFSELFGLNGQILNKKGYSEQKRFYWNRFVNYIWFGYDSCIH